MGGAAPAADPEGNIYAISGNGRFDANGWDFGNSFIKLSSPALTVVDYFTPFNQLYLERADLDLGSSGAVLLPDLAGSMAHRRLLVSAGKEGRIYLLDRDRLGRYRDNDGQIVQSIEGAIGALFAAPAYFRDTLYFAAANDRVKAFSISAARIGRSLSSQSSHVIAYPGAVPAISANGSANGIVWLAEGGAGQAQGQPKSERNPPHEAPTPTPAISAWASRTAAAGEEAPQTASPSAMNSVPASARVLTAAIVSA